MRTFEALCVMVTPTSVRTPKINEPEDVGDMVPVSSDKVTELVKLVTVFSNWSFAVNVMLNCVPAV